jgi:hypothetical protein
LSFTDRSDLILAALAELTLLLPLLLHTRIPLLLLLLLLLLLQCWTSCVPGHEPFLH